ncbi:MAG: hypothetical protein WBQ87_04585 [Candidatus Sulfotelmatobacter sp.]
MVNDDLVRCPVCGGFTHIDKPELRAALNDSNIRQQLENYIAELSRAPSAEVVVAGRAPRQEFNKEVHNWNPNIPVWRRSPKE